MSQDDDEDCEHVWKLAGVHLGEGVDAEYECTRCGAVMVRVPGQPFPGTV